MSKYIKLDSAIKAYNQAVKELVESEMEEFELNDFTECQFDTTQIKLIARMIASLPTIEVSEDCISRENLLKTIDDKVSQQYSYTYETYGLDLWALFVRIVKNAPSVLPKPKEGEWKITNTYKDPSGRVVDRVEHTDCGYIWNREMGEPLHNFCPYCGKKMKGEKE